ncbi:hypothetical protein, partial [Lentilactobacillus buchneri]|uniref:hypothetical protein n=1 Tax=Lentilactobacillus buchneri TaxID=1581 RepID=UPI0039E79DC2
MGYDGITLAGALDAQKAALQYLLLVIDFYLLLMTDFLFFIRIKKADISCPFIKTNNHEDFR